MWKTAAAHTAPHHMTYSEPESELVFKSAFVDTRSAARLSSNGDGIW